MTMIKRPNTAVLSATCGSVRNCWKRLPDGACDDLRQYFFASAGGAALLELGGKTLQAAILESCKDRVVDITAAADSRCIGEIIGGPAHSLQNLFAPPAFA